MSLFGGFLRRRFRQIFDSHEYQYEPQYDGTLKQMQDDFRARWSGRAPPQLIDKAILITKDQDGKYILTKEG